MDGTLRQLLEELFKAHKAIDTLRARVQELEQAHSAKDHVTVDQFVDMLQDAATETI